MIRAAHVLLTLALCAPSLACAGRVPDAVEDAAAYAETDRGRAAELLEQAVPEASARHRATVQLHAGEYRRLLGDFDTARTWFDAVQAEDGRHSNPLAARAGLLLIEAATEVNPDVLAKLRRMSDNDLLDSQNADRYMVLAIVAAAEGDQTAFSRAQTKALSYARSSQQQTERITLRLDGIDVEAEPVAGEAVFSMEPETGSDIERIEQAIASGNAGRAQTLIARLRTTASAEEARELDYLERRMGAADVNPGVIGVLLPLAGRYATVGRQVKQALEFGYAAGGGSGRLLIVDSGTTEESAVAAAEQLVFAEGVIAIAGPLLSNQADAVAAASDAMRVPLVGLAQSMSPGTDQEWVFRATVAVEDQVSALVDYTSSTGGMSSYGIFAPDNDYGRGAAAAFTAKVESTGGRIVDQEFYNPDSNDMTGAARRMSRSPMDGLFIPDNASRVPLACAGLAYEEFPVGSFQPVPGGPTIQLLGLNSWNNVDILTQGGAYVRHALFTELFIDDTTASASFSEAYRGQVDRTPSPLEAVVSDVGRLLATIDQAGVTDRTGYRDALHASAPEGTVTGLNGFNAETRTATHNLRILTITRDSIEVVK